MRILSKSDSYAVVELTDFEASSLGTVSKFAVIDIFYDSEPLLKNIVGTFVFMEEAEDWAREHE